jgi:hypothetical protein
VDLKVDAAGSLYFLARGGGGGIFKIQFQAPTITGQPANSTVNAGQTATFTVSATGTGTLSYQWQQLVGNNWTNLTNGGRIAGATSTTLTITNTQSSDAGTYRAIVRNSNGATTASNGASLTVTTGTAPSITGQPASQTINVGGTASFTVTASGAAPLAYQWQQFISGSWTNLTNGGRIAGATSPTLTISNVATGDAGQYRVTVSNSFGTATSNAATLTVNQFPTATITAPAAGTLWTFGQTINFAGTASDPENGTLPASAFTWEVLFGHDVHTHPHMAPTTGIMSGSFVANFNETDPDVFYRIVLTVRDANGAAFTTSRDIFPQKVQLTLNTVPAGLALSLDGQPVTGPEDSVVGVTRTLQAPTTQTSGGTTYNFVSWSDGGAATHTIVTPSTNSTYTATYQVASGQMPGLRAEFFDFTTSLSTLPNLNGLTPNVARTDARINYAATSSAWIGLTSNYANTFASRHTGFVNIGTAGSYTFYLNSDDGSRLWLDDQLIIDNNGLHSMRELSATRTLTAGFHSLRVEFFENAGSAGLILSWAGPGISKQVIPAGALFQSSAAFQQDSGPDGLVVVEVENNDANVSQGGKTWQGHSAAGYSGGGALRALSNTGVNNDTGYVANSPRLDFRVNFTRTGTHYVWVRGIGPNGNDDSVHVGLDGQAVASADRISSFATGYSWTRNTMDGVVATINVATAGVHTVNLWMREDGTVVDKLLLTTNTSYTPTGTGPAQSPRSGGVGPAMARLGPAAVSAGSGVTPAFSSTSSKDSNDVLWAWSDALARLGVQAGVGSEPQSTNSLDDGQWDHAALIGDVTTGAATLAAEARITPIGGRLVGSGMYLKEVLEELGFGNELLGAVEI